MYVWRKGRSQAQTARRVSALLGTASSVEPRRAQLGSEIGYTSASSCPKRESPCFGVWRFQNSDTHSRFKLRRIPETSTLCSPLPSFDCTSVRCGPGPGPRCKLCGAGKFSIAGAMCLDCPAGQRSAPSHTTCDCMPGFHSNMSEHARLSGLKNCYSCSTLIRGAEGAVCTARDISAPTSESCDVHCYGGPYAQAVAFAGASTRHVSTTNTHDPPRKYATC